MTGSLAEIIRRRRSVRTFNGIPLRPEHREAMEEFLKTLENPFQVPVEFRLLEADAHGLTSPVIVGAGTYFAAKVLRTADHEMALGYSFEKACLYACSLGLGTVMLASTLNRSAFERAMAVGEKEVMPVASPIGYPAEKMSVRESVMRRGVKADTRRPFESLYCRGAFSVPLHQGEAGCYGEALEAARWAPSAVNGQPWRAVLDGERVHFFVARSMKINALCDIQKVDVGIALAHFDWVLREQGIDGEFVKEQPEIKLPSNTEYLVTFRKTV